MTGNDEKLFEELNIRLKDQRLSLTIICVGGYVLSRYGMRTTQDIDAFYEATQKTDAIIYEVGDKYHANTDGELWLNNAVQDMNPRPPESVCETIYDFSNLKVLTPPLDYIAGMKLFSGRGQDIEDVAAILKELSIEDPERFRQTLAGYGFAAVDESLLLEAFGLAYGMEWLEQYYIEHEEDIINRTRGSSS